MTHPLAYDPCPKPARLHPQVLTRSGVVPCATGPIEITLLNTSDERVRIPKYAVVAEIFLLNPLEYDTAISESEQDLLQTAMRDKKRRRRRR